nr:dynamin family protein [uncultured Desulfobacter sp.]
MTLQPQEFIEKLVVDTLSVIDSLATVSNRSDKSLVESRQLCSKIPSYISEGILRVAVVGVIKSGKSTFINAMSSRELVQRGAGVVTSITTRIRKGKKNRAIIHLKSWDDINSEIESCLEMFPGKDESPSFDIRRTQDRHQLRRIFDTIVSAFPMTSQGIRPEALVIRNALDGYRHCLDVIGSDEQTISFDAKSFNSHKQFTADPAKAFYVKDVCLEVYGKTINSNVEIADCQGADSTDPEVLEKIFSYLEAANLIVYCISSRTGLRQSDMVFLKRIKRLGLMENILFVFNCDLSEHENLDNLKVTRDKTIAELKLLVPDVRIFSFSALYTLFDGLGKRLSSKNKKRLGLWQEDKEMTAFCTKEYTRFLEAFNLLFEASRFNLFYANHIERLKIVTHILDEKIKLLFDVFSAGLLDQEKARKRLADLEGNARRLKVIVDNSVMGAVSALRREIEYNLKNAFLKDSENITKLVTEFIRQAKIDSQPYRTGVDATGFKQILYMMFQDFKRKLDLFILEQVTPELKQLVRIQEERIESYFKSLLDSYRIDYVTMGAPENREDERFSLELIKEEEEYSRADDLENIKKILGLHLPNQIFSPEYTRAMQANAVTDFSLHSLVLFVSAMMDKHVRFSFTPGLDRAAVRIKKKTQNVMQRQIKAYHSSLKQDYFFPLIDAVTRDFKDKILQRFTMYETLNKDMDELFCLKQEEKKQHLVMIKKAKNDIIRLRALLDEFSIDFGTNAFESALGASL